MKSYHVLYSLRTKIMLLVLLSLSPSCILLFYANQHERSELRRAAFHDALTLAKNLSAQQEQLINNASQTLFSISQIFESIEPKRIDSQKILSEFQKRNPQLVSFFIAKPDGELMASSAFFPKGFTISGRPIYPLVMRQKVFTIGGFSVTRLTKKPILSMAYPTLGKNGEVKTLYITGLDLTRIDQFIGKSQLPHGAILIIIDRNGTLLYQYPNTPNRIGNKVGHVRSAKDIVKRQEGTLETVDEDGVERLYGFSTFGQPKGSVFIAVAIPNKDAFAEVDKAILHQIISFAIVLFLALSAAWLVSSYVIIKPLNNIVHAAQLIADGNLTYRIEDKGSHGEIQSLSRSFNQMAESLNQRSEERRKVEDALRESELRYRTLVKNLPQKIFTKDRNSVYISCNEHLASDFGVTPEAMKGKTDYDYFPKELADKYQADDKRIMDSGKAETIEEQYLLGTQLFWVHTIKTPLRDEHGNTVGILGIFNDITDRKKAEQELHDILDSLRKAVNTTIQVMASAVETRDPYTAGHQVRAADLARAIATDMGLSQDKIDAIRLAGSIHDIGKLSIPAEILSKPTKLSEIEFSLIKEHARKGYEMLKNVESPWPLAEIVHQHHERVDGSGYPKNLKGEDILIEARILAVADVVESMASHRPYRPSLGIEAALNEIAKNSGIFYDKIVVDACLKLFREKNFQLKEHVLT